MKHQLRSWGTLSHTLNLALLAGLVGSVALTGCGSSKKSAPAETESGLIANAEASLEPQPEALIVVDGDVSDWPADAAVVADEHFIYFRFMVENEELTLQAAPQPLAIMLDIDSNTATGRRDTLEPTDTMGIDLEIQFSPLTSKGVERGVAMFSIDRSGNRVKVDFSDFDFLFAPTYASAWYEARISRTPDRVGNLPTAGMLSSGRVSGVITLLTKNGEIDAWSDPFALDLGNVCVGGKRLSSLEPPAKADGAIRVVSWNVKRSAPVGNPAPFKHILTSLNPDIILLQEWDAGDSAAMQGWFTAMLPSESSWNVRKRAGGVDEGGGVAIVSRFPISPTLGDTLEVANEGDRKARPIRYIGARITTPYGDVYAASTHLKCCGTKDSPEDIRRTLEARTINANFASASGSAPPDAIRVIGGDLNLVGSRPPLDLLRAGIDTDGTELAIADAQTQGDRTYSTWRDAGQSFTPGRLDYIVYSDSNAKAVAAFVLDTERFSDEALAMMGLSRTDSNASDHLPVVVDLVPIAK
jgi:endonuclease/exonuclease/phosphatase family metal-dependent hydrolase